MKKSKDSAFGFMQKMNDIKVDEKILFSTNMYNKDGQIKECEKEFNFSFSVMQGLIVATATLASAVLSIYFLKKCEKNKTIKNLHKKYIFIPHSECTQKNESVCEKNKTEK